MPFQLLSRLWLSEPDSTSLTWARALFSLPQLYELPELAQAYADLFLLNVYPYSTIYTQPSAELNGPAAALAARRYAEHGYQPPELSSVGAADHLGLGLGLLGHLARAGQERAFAAACGDLLAWAPAACLAVEREPGVHPFYRALAAYTAETLLLNAGHLQSPGAAPAPDLSLNMAGDDEEVRLRDVLHFFLSPARCGIFLSRGRLGRLGHDLGLALPFGAREIVAETLFNAAGQSGQLQPLLAALRAEIAGWSDAYRRWQTAFPAWSPVARMWLARTSASLERLDAMAADGRRILDEGGSEARG